MKILLINTWFDFGSTGKIVKSIYDKLTKTGIDAYVIYGRGKKQKLQNVSRSSSKIECMLCSLLSRFTRDIYGGAYFSTKRIIKKINEIKPDLINVHCTNSFYVNNKELFTYIGKSGINTVLTLHAEFQYTGNCTHTYDCQKYITGCHDCVRHREIQRSILADKTARNFMEMKSGFDSFNDKKLEIVCVSDWLRQKASVSKILSRFQNIVIENGIDNDVFRFKRNISPESKIINVLFVTPNYSSSINDIKNCYLFLQIARDLTNAPVHFTICSASKPRTKVSLPENTTLIIGSSQTDLAKIYQSNDIVLMLSKKETFSMVCAEAIACGCELMLFKSGGPETIFPKYGAEVFEQGDVTSIEKRIVNWERKPIEEYQKNSEVFLEEYSQNKMTEKYIMLFENILNREVSREPSLEAKENHIKEEKTKK